MIVEVLKIKTNLKSENGFTLIAAILLTVVMGLILASYSMVANIDLKSAKSSIDYHTSAYSAEAGLNIRAEEFRDSLTNGVELLGASPTENQACEGSNLGTGNFACKDYALGKQSFTTYASQDPDAVKTRSIPVGEPFSGLLATETTYTVHAFSRNASGNKIGAVAQSKIRARQVPLFQFAAFYDKDLEFDPGQNMVMSGPIHTNKDIYLSPVQDLLLNGQLTIAGDFYRGSKYFGNCPSGSISKVHINQNLLVSLAEPLNLDAYKSSTEFLDNFVTMQNIAGYGCSGGGVTSLADQDFAEWNDNVRQDISPVSPPPTTYNAVGAGNRLWDLADVRIVLKLNAVGDPQEIEVQDVNQVRLEIETNNIISNCGSVLDYTSPTADDHFWDQMRQVGVVMLEVDVEGLLTCLDSQGIVSYGDSTNDGHILFFTFAQDSVDTSCATKPCYNNYGIRYKNGANLIDLDTNLNGVTLATDQPVYLQGDFNEENAAGDKLPVSLYGDSLSLLSNNWGDAYDDNTRTQQGIFESNFDGSGNFTGGSYATLRDEIAEQMLMHRQATDTTYNTALVFGTTTTGGVEGPAGQGLGSLTNPSTPRGGIVNYGRLFEKWGTNLLKIKGSFISLEQQWRAESKNHKGDSVGVFPNYHYTVPRRDFSFDTMFNNPNTQPPGALSFVYLKQEFFSQDFNQ